MKNLIVFLFFLLGINYGHSQIVTGIIHDSSKKPLSGVIITEKSTSNNVVSDKNGKFTIAINNLVDNKYLLGISIEGYHYTEVSAFAYETKLQIEMIRIDETLDDSWKKIPEEKEKEKEKK